MKTIKFTITTPERTVYSEDVEQVTIPTKMGEITVLPGHIPLAAGLVAGELRALKSGQEMSMAVSGGFVEVLPEAVTILADSAEHAHEIDEAKAEEARARAVALLSVKHVDAEEFAVLSAQMERELARLKVARKKKYRDVR
ncbi:ATP synthase F1 subunit epsilon [Candidatus Falkowbacteria bacterium]|nr:ATP synthase F1 subunit epsilon [Candidatus Falkowbacteria bacterium]